MTGAMVQQKRMAHDNLGRLAKSRGGNRSRDTATSMTSILQSMSLLYSKHRYYVGLFLVVSLVVIKRSASKKLWDCHKVHGSDRWHCRNRLRKANRGQAEVTRAQKKRIAEMQHNLEEQGLVYPPLPKDIQIRTQAVTIEEMEPWKWSDVDQGEITYGDENKSMPYYRCGPPTKILTINPELTEVVLLRGAKSFSKENWKTSGILETLCNTNNNDDMGNLLVTAWDLDEGADGNELVAAFDAMSAQQVISGRPAVIISPSASGKALIGLAAMRLNPKIEQDDLKRIVKAWVPVSPTAALRAQDAVLEQYKTSNIPTLAIHGDQDPNGDKIALRLITNSGRRCHYFSLFVANNNINFKPPRPSN